MDVIDYLRKSADQVHAGYDRALAGLTNEQLFHKPGGAANHIGFIAWHWVRTEDNIVQWVLQRQPTVWLDNGLPEQWDLPKNEQGSGMPTGDAHALALPSSEAFLDYARDVWKRTDTYLQTLTDEELSRMTKINRTAPEVPVLQAIGSTLFAHGNQHLGEITLIRELQGLTSTN